MTDPPSLLTLHRQAYNLVELASTGFHHYASFFFCSQVFSLFRSLMDLELLGVFIWIRDVL
jgi:hypothetical protein